MRTIIAGSRGCTDPSALAAALQSCGWVPTLVISGTARGVDRMGEEWAERAGVPAVRYPAEWERYGVSAGHRRNAVMAGHAQALVALWDGKSRGTAHMIQTAQRRGLRVFVWRV